MIFSRRKYSGNVIFRLTLPLPLIKLPPEIYLFLMRIAEVDPGHNTGHSCAHAHIAQIKNAREHCVHFICVMDRK